MIINNKKSVGSAHISLIGYISIAAITGCTTTMSGEPVPTDKTIKDQSTTEIETGGIRYYLPAPHIMLKPKADGTVDLKVLYLPDPNNAYTLDVDSYFSSTTLDVTLENGMLKTINLNADSSELTENALTNAAEIKKAQINADQEKKKTEEADKTAEKDKIKSAIDAVTSKEEELALLYAKRDYYKSLPQGTIKAEDIRNLELKIIEEEIKLDFLKKKTSITTDDAANDPAAFNSPTPIDDSLNYAWGPVLFRVLPDSEGIKMVAIEGQQQYKTSTSGVAPTFDVKPNPAIVKQSDESKEIEFTLTQPVVEIDYTRTRLVDPSLGSNADPILDGNKIPISLIENNKMRLALPPSLPARTYRLDTALIIKGDHASRDLHILIHWLVE